VPPEPALPLDPAEPNEPPLEPALPSGGPPTVLLVLEQAVSARMIHADKPRKKVMPEV
jgi:hypothetical protein